MLKVTQEELNLAKAVYDNALRSFQGEMDSFNKTMLDPDEAKMLASRIEDGKSIRDSMPMSLRQAGVYLRRTSAVYGFLFQRRKEMIDDIDNSEQMA